MNNNNDILGGFSALFDELKPNEDIKLNGVEISGADDDTKDSNPFNLVDEPDDQLEEIELEVDKGEPTDNELEYNKDTEPVDENESSQVSMFFDAVAETVGWSDVSDEEKPKSVEDFVDYIKRSVEENSKPAYSSDEIAQLDEFVRNGGDIRDYFSTPSSQDYDDVDLTDVNTQKEVVAEFLREKGFSDSQIKRKLEKYEDADILEDEAADAVESLKEIRAENKKALLDAQKSFHENQIQEQQNFYNGVISEIEALTDVRGIKINKDEKKPFMDFLLKIGPDGKTAYQKKYSESATRNLIESAYFTWKGDTLLDRAKASGETSATQRLKNTLKTTKVGGSTERIDNGSPEPIWSAFSRTLRRPQ